ncbi:MAG TPA: hypothetical protein VGN81_17775 [Pseudonocardiaceae bacterium]
MTTTGKARVEERSGRVRVLSFVIVLVIMVVSFVVVRIVGPTPPLTEVTVIAGSENQPFFADPAVIDAFAAHGYQLDVEFQGSWEMTKAPDLCAHDLMLPSSEPAADAVSDRCHVASGQPAYYSPMVIVTRANIAALLQQEGIAKHDPKSGEWTFDLSRYLQLVQSGLRWNQIPGNTTFQSPNKMLIGTTDPQKSNSAAMYASMAAYLLNDDIPLSSMADVDRVAPFIKQYLFDAQGYLSNSTEQPFLDFRGSLGESVEPMLWGYEAQYLDVALNSPGDIPAQGIVMMYPSPTAVAYHTIVPTSDNGTKVGQLLTGQTSDPTFLKLEAKHGWRTLDPQDTFTSLMRSRGISVPTAPDIAPLPASEFLQALLKAIK